MLGPAFSDFFVDRGYRALALSLRGHSNSPAPKGPRASTVGDYWERFFCARTPHSVVVDYPARLQGWAAVTERIDGWRAARRR